MSVSSNRPREFVDANILVYAHDASAGAKKAVAESLLTRLWETGSGATSIQVLQEFYVTVTAKVARPLTTDEATARLEEFAVWPVFSPTVTDLKSAIELAQQSRIAFWDAMIVHAAAESGCSVLWTEDLNDGQVIKGVRIGNPFAGSPVQFDEG